MASFVVFQDPQTSSTPPPSVSKASETNSSQIINPTPILFATDKENIDPFTGESARTSSNEAKNKKRKTGVLATKAYSPPPEDDEEAKVTKPQTKNRKGSKSQGSKGKPTGGKNKQASGSKRKGKSDRSSRKANSLPKVSEETETESASQREAERISQAEIDSKVYELTVKPLADVTRAFAQGPSKGEKAKQRPFKGACTGPEVNYALPKFSDVVLPSKPRQMSDPLSSPAREVKMFTTPERKKIYAAFTFSSPTPIPNGIVEPVAERAASEPPQKPRKTTRSKGKMERKSA